MATMTGTAAVKEAIKERLTPARESLEQNTREAKRAILHGRHAAEDFIEETALRTRRHPLSALAVAAGAGGLTGCLIGFAFGRRVR
jgi:ElaB/YqjD/DUF883 family membrane-anchored ribosome-binding protein